MKQSTHLGLFIAAVMVAAALIMTGIIFPLLISTDKLPLWLIIVLFIFIFLIIIVFFQWVFDAFLKQTKRKTKKKDKQ